MPAESDEARLLNIQTPDSEQIKVSPRERDSWFVRHRDGVLCVTGCFVLAVAIFGVVALVRSMSPATQRTPLLILSMDGFRFDYLSNESSLADPMLPYRPLPNLRSFLRSGAHLRDGLTASFPTKTFPNHWSLVTGMYEESHGIVGNVMFDPAFNARFDAHNVEAKWWDLRDPIWLYAKRLGLKTASFFWPGSAVIGRTPHTFIEPYDDSIPFDKRVDTVVEWLKTHDFVTLYFEEPDTAGHTSGPYSAVTTNALEKLDTAIGRLLSKLDRPVNIIITADHGMAETSPERVIVLESIINITDVALTETNPVVGIWPNQNVSVDKLFAQLNGSQASQQGLITVFLHPDIPAEFHFSNHRRIPPIIVIAKEGYATVVVQSQVPSACCGTHGYNNSLPSMHPLLLVRGPAFRDDGYAHDVLVRNVDVFPLLCHLLDLPIPSDINGSLTGLRPLLRP